MGLVSTLTPLVLGVARRNPQAGRLAYRALAGGVGTARAVRGAASGAASGARGIASGAAGHLARNAPIIGSVALAGDAYLNYHNATQNGEDPGRAAFKGIGRVIGNVGGGIGGGALGGPIGGVAGGLAGGEVGDRAFGKVYDWMSGGNNTPVPKPLTVEEQRAIRARRGNNAGSAANNNGMMNIAGFQYSPGADTGLVGLRMGQQFQHNYAIQGFSRDKHLSNNQTKQVLGQQDVDKYGMRQLSETERLKILQGNITERFGIGKAADVENRRTLKDERIGLGQQFTDRYKNYEDNRTERHRIDGDVTVGLGKQFTERYGMDIKGRNELYGLQTQRQLGNRDRDANMYDLREGYGLKERERRDKRYMFDQKSLLEGRQIDNNFAVSGMGILAGLYR